MFQDVCGPRTGAKACRIDSASLKIELPVRINGKQQFETIDLKPFLKAHLRTVTPQTN